MTSANGLEPGSRTDQISDSRDSPIYAGNRAIADTSSGVKSAYIDEFGNPLQWADAIDVFADRNNPGDRFGAEWTRRLWGRWFERDRALLDNGVNTTLMLTLTASPWLSEQYLLPPAHQLQALQRGREKVLEVLSETLDIDHHTGWVIGVNRSGYFHIHIGVWATEDVDPIKCEPALQAYLEDCPLADPSYHGEGAITIRRGKDILAPDTRTDTHPPASRLMRYLVNNIPGSDRGVLAEAKTGEVHRLKGAAVLDALGTDVYRRPAKP